MSFMQFKFVFFYLYAMFNEALHFWYVYLILSLPPYMFNDLNEITLKRDEEEKIWIKKVDLILKKTPTEYTYDHISGRQLMTLSDDYGRIAFNELLRYYPALDTIYVQYLKLDGTNETVTRVVDVQKRLELRSASKCKFGRIDI